MTHRSLSWAMVALLACTSALSAQQEHRPIGQNNPLAKPLNQVDAFAVPALNRPAIFAEDLANDGPGVAPRYAIPHAVDLTPLTSGTWDMFGNTSLWRLRIQCPGASHVNLGFQRFKMPEGAQMMVYAADYSYVVRPFTGRDHNPDGQLWTPVVFGDEIVVELAVPTALRNKAQLRLTQIGSGYRFFGFGNSALLAEGSGSCNINVACPQSAGWEAQISAVAAISTGGSVFCSGAMVNNTANDNRDYFLTADHCGINNGNASSLVCYWNYEDSGCAASGSGSLSQFTTGATFRADYAASDFTLVELNSSPAAAWNVGYAGWNRGSGNASSAVAIHHPSGDSKKISFENQATTTTSYGGTSSPGNGTHVRVIDWDLGTTEGGSSGSPLFDQNKRIIGQLHGGGAACGNNLSDWYGRFSVSWTGGGNNGSRLSNWLDPIGTGAITIDTIGGGGGGPTGPANDECSGAIVVTDGVNGVYSSSGASTSAPTWQCASGGADVWFVYTAPCAGTATFDTCSPTRNYDTAIEAFSGSCGSLTQLACNDDSCSFGSSLTINTVIGGTYYIRVGGYQSATGVFDLTVSCSGTTGPANDECSGAVAVSDGVNGPFSNVTATSTASPTWSCGSGGNDLWFAYVATCTGDATVDVCSPTLTYDSVLEVFGGSCGALSLIGCNDDACGLASGSELTFATTTGTTYYIRVGGYQGASGSFDVTIDCVPDSFATATPYGSGCNDGARTFWESPEQGAFDLSLSRLILTPNANDGYDVTSSSLAWTAPSGGDLGLGDDQVSIQTLPFTLTFPGGATNQIGVCSNGYIWLDGVTTNADWSVTTAEFVAQAPRLAPLWTDYNPSAGGSVHYVEQGGNVYVTWSGVPEFNQTNASSFQCVIMPNSTIEYRYLNCVNEATNRDTIVGFTPGLGSLLPDPADLSALGSLSTSGPDGVPLTLVANNTPVIGTTLSLSTQNIPAGSLGGAILFGFTQYNPGLDLSIIDMPGCELLQNGDFTIPFAGIPSALTTLPIPSDPGLTGAHLYAQSASISPGQNLLGVLMSNGMDLLFDVQ